VDRKDLQSLSRIRAREAKALLDAGLHDGAFYLAGYAVECALKACIAKATKRHEFPDRDHVNKSYTHKLDDLIKLAGLDKPHRTLMKSNSGFGRNWNTVSLWSEQSRYRTHDQASATAIVKAIMERRDGILAWLRRYW
jgi:hypothetical protein